MSTVRPAALRGMELPEGYNQVLLKDAADELERLTTALSATESVIERLRRLHTESEWRPLDGTYLGGTVCDHCRRDWPCSTMRIVGAGDDDKGQE